MEMPPIARCDVTDCSYNQQRRCHAAAITVGDTTHPRCDTFVQSDERGGDEDTNGRVGACKVTSCIYNQRLECAAQTIAVGRKESEVDCLTFEPR